MSDPEDTHDDVSICPECKAYESFDDDGRCRECHHGICGGCLHEPVLIDRRNRCEDCGGSEHCDICGCQIALDYGPYPLCKRCEQTARAAARYQAEADRQLKEFGGDPRGAKR